MNNIYLFLVYSLSTITIIYLIHAVILTELNKYNKHNNKTGDYNYDGYKEWSLREQHNGNTFTKNKNINPNIIRNRVIHKLQNVFPDSNITQSHHNCCDYYKITW